MIAKLKELLRTLQHQLNLVSLVARLHGENRWLEYQNNFTELTSRAKSNMLAAAVLSSEDGILTITKDNLAKVLQSNYEIKTDVCEKTGDVTIYLKDDKSE